MRLIDYINLIRQRLALVGAVMGTVALISLGFTLTKPPIYEASVRLRTLPSAPDALGSSVSEVLGSSSLSFTTPGTEALLVQSTEVGQMVAERLQLAVPPEQLIKQVTVTGVPDTTVLVLSASAAEPVAAIQLANTFADSYLASRRQDANEALDKASARLTERLSEVQTRLADLESRVVGAVPGSINALDVTAQRDLALTDLQVIRAQLRDLSDRQALEGGFGEVIVPASEARTVRSTSPTRSLVFGLLLGGPVALAVVLLIDSLSQTIRTKADAELITGVDVLGLIPADPVAGRYASRYVRNSGGRQPGRIRLPRRRRPVPALTVDADPFSSASEAYRTASLNLANAIDRAGARTVLVTSSITGEGKTTAVTNLAVAHAEHGHAVVLVDADLRRPMGHDMLGADGDLGLAEVVKGEATPRKVIQPLRERLSFVAAGAPVERPDQLLTRADLAHVLAKLSSALNGSRANGNGNGNGNGRKASPVVLLDSAPVLQAAETLSLARSADGVVLVVRSGITRRQAASRTVEQLRRAGTPLLGVILVGVTEGEHLGMGGSYGSGRRSFGVVDGNGHATGPPGVSQGLTSR